MLPRKLLYVSLAIAWLTPHVQASEQRPNILFIVADDLGWADTNPYGSTFHETPNINRLAQRGMRFQNFHSSSPVCSPARASLLTGLYAERLGMIQPACHIQRVSLKASLPTAASPQQKVIAPRGTTRLDTRFPNYAKVLGAHGYLTAHYGKWHLGAAPTLHESTVLMWMSPTALRMAPKGVTSAPKNTVKALAYKPESI